MTNKQKQRFRVGFQAGVAAGVVTSVVMLLLSVTLNGISLPDVVGNAITAMLSANTFQSLHQAIGADAKYYLFSIILVGQCLVFGLCGGTCNLLTDRIHQQRGQPVETAHSQVLGLWLAALLWLLTGTLLLPLLGAGIFGSALGSGLGNGMWSLAIDGLLFGQCFVLIHNWMLQHFTDIAVIRVEQNGNTAFTSRRLFIQRGAIVLGIGALGLLLWKVFSNSTNPATQASLESSYQPVVTPPANPYSANFQPVAELSSEITSNDQFYMVSKNLFSDPSVDAQSWNLAITGSITKPYTLTYAELMAMTMSQEYDTLTCISNTVGGSYISNAYWEGIPLSSLLARAGTLNSSATKIVLYAADDYSDSIHLSKALEPTTLVALKMNGVPLPMEHGFPARVLVPGIYGMKHVKWLTRIDVTTTDYQGYWQQRGWDDAAPVQLMSRIDTPADSTTVHASASAYIAGVAFSGNKGISRVDVSVDNGSTWQPALLKQPLSALTWVLWELNWTPVAGTHTIMVRAVDLHGNVQIPMTAQPAPTGATGYHTITITAQ